VIYISGERSLISDGKAISEAVTIQALFLVSFTQEIPTSFLSTIRFLRLSMISTTESLIPGSVEYS